MTGRRLLALTSTGQMSGAEHVLTRVLTAAVEAGWEVTCLAPEGELERELSAVGVRRVPVPELGRSRGGSSAAAVRAGVGTVVTWLRAARVLRDAARRSDVVLANSLTALPVLRLARLRTPTVWLAHDVVARPDRLRLYRACRGVLTLVVAVSEAVAVPLRSCGGPRITVVHNGVQWPVERSAGDPESQAVVGLNALMTPWKGHEVLLDAVPLLPADVVVELIGGELRTDADYAARLRRRVAAPHLRGRVRVLGHVADPLARMRHWSVAVSASTAPEACPLNVLEAMSLGVPVVATDHGGAPEVLAGSGMLVPPDDPTALASAVTRLLTDAELHGRCATLGRDRIAAGHQAGPQTAAALRLLERVVAEGGSR